MTRFWSLVAVAAVLTLTVADAQKPTVYTPGDGVTPPRPTKQIGAAYTPGALQNRIQGVVGLAAVVLSDGKVGAVEVVESLDKMYGLDEQAVKAIKQWEFKPGTKDGKAVAVRIRFQINFTLK